VHVRVLCPALGDKIHERDEGVSLLSRAVRPGRDVLLGGVEDTPEVLEADAAEVAFVVERVALEVEEQVTLGWSRKQREHLRRGRRELVGDRRTFSSLHLLPLQSRLGAELVEGRLRHPVRLDRRSREIGDRPDAGLRRVELAALLHPQPGDTDDVVRRCRGCSALRALATGDESFIAPRDGDASGSVRGQQMTEPLAPLDENRHHVGDAEVSSLAIAQQQRHGRGQWQVHPLDLVGVRPELEQCTRLGRARELGVAHHPAVVGAFNEVGVPEELPVEERRLVDHIRRVHERFKRRIARRLDLRHRVRRLYVVQHSDIALRRQIPQESSLVPVAEPPDVLQERVLLLLDRIRPAELVVKGPQEGVLAFSCDGEIGCTPVELAVDEKHR